MTLDKIKGWEEALAWVGDRRSAGCNIVFTNGCFDILHLGHVRLLEEAKTLGDKLIVGLNSDRSARELKGENRPVRLQEERAEVLAGLKSVDAVVIFDELNPLKLIVFLRPDVLVKGGDWTLENIIGAKEVEGWGGEVRSLPVLPGRSTTEVLEKIKESGEKR